MGRIFAWAAVGLALCALVGGALWLRGRQSSSEPAAPAGAWGHERHLLLNKRAAEAGRNAEVVFIGDSITQLFEDAGKNVWARFYASRNALNLGVSGDRTQHVLWRLANGNLEGLAPKAAVLMIGTNNSSDRHQTAADIVAGITAIVKLLRAKLPGTKLILTAILPRGEGYNVVRGGLAQVNQVVRRLADEKTIFWLDFGHRLLDDDGSVSRELMPDRLHLSEKGYGIWAESMEGLLSPLLGGPAKVTPSWLSR